MVGTTIRGYRVITELGSGGMGTVYFAEHPTIGRRAAIKVLNREISGDETMVTRFFNEARSVNAIRHPNIVDITDFGELDDTYFIFMEFLEGETLGERLEKKRVLDEAAARGILVQIASAVGAVHEKGIVHRDLKPENIFLTNHPDYRDFVKVLDFGLVKMPAATNGGEAKVTHPGMVMGTPAYMSPEQCRADSQIDARTDLYALGAMAFEMLSGRTVFDGELVEQLHAHIHTAPPSLRDLNPAVSLELADLVSRCLAKRPEDRPSSMREVRDKLRGEAVAADAIPDRLAPPVARVLQRTYPPTRPEIARQELVEREQSDRVSEKLGNIVAKRLASNSLALPSPPTAAVKCLALIDQPNCKFSEIAQVLEQDPLISSKVLRLVNSAFYGTRVKTTSVDMAVGRLGLKHLRLVLQEMSIETVFASKNPRIRAAFRDLWAHCLAVAHLARGLAKSLPNAADPDQAYLAGLVHDIGKPVVAVLLLEAERGLTDEDKQWMSESLWLRSVNQSHRQVGVALAKNWRFPPELLDTIKQGSKFNEKLGRQSCVNLVCMANAIAKCEGLYLGTIDLEATMGLVVRGRELLGVDEKLEATLTKDLADLMNTATSGM